MPSLLLPSTTTTINDTTINAISSIPPLLLPSTLTTIAAVNDRHCHCRTVNNQWWWQSLLTATAMARGDVGKGGRVHMRAQGQGRKGSGEGGKQG
jgi:hypothetical protein